MRERNNNFFFVAPIYCGRAFVRPQYEGISGFVRRGGAALVLALRLRLAILAAHLCGKGALVVGMVSRGRILARS